MLVPNLDLIRCYKRIFKVFYLLVCLIFSADFKSVVFECKIAFGRVSKWLWYR